MVRQEDVEGYVHSTYDARHKQWYGAYTPNTCDVHHHLTSDVDCETRPRFLKNTHAVSEALSDLCAVHNRYNTPPIQHELA